MKFFLVYYFHIRFKFFYINFLLATISSRHLLLHALVYFLFPILISSVSITTPSPPILNALKLTLYQKFALISSSTFLWPHFQTGSVQDTFRRHFIQIHIIFQTILLFDNFNLKERPFVKRICTFTLRISTT